MRWWYVVVPLVILALVVGAAVLVGRAIASTAPTPTPPGPAPRPTQPTWGPPTTTQPTTRANPAPTTTATTRPTGSMGPTTTAAATPRTPTVPKPSGATVRVKVEGWTSAARPMDVSIYVDSADQDYDGVSGPFAIEFDVPSTTRSIGAYVDDERPRDAAVMCQVSINGVIVSTATGKGYTSCNTSLSRIFGG